MPLTVQKIEENSLWNLNIWSVTETLTDLYALANLSENDQMLCDSIHLEKRKREWLVRKILAQSVSEGLIIQNLANGKPVLTDGRFISISHCDNLVALIISNKMVGIDLQSPSGKLVRIARKFCHNHELKMAENSQKKEEYFAIVWSVKEAIFKTFGEGVIFAEDILLDQFDAEDSVITASYKGRHGSKKFQLGHFVHESCHVIYTL
jgi:4'-phosphopantetheinyl transferase